MKGMAHGQRNDSHPRLLKGDPRLLDRVCCSSDDGLLFAVNIGHHHIARDGR